MKDAAHNRHSFNCGKLLRMRRAAENAGRSGREKEGGIAAPGRTDQVLPTSRDDLRIIVLPPSESTRSLPGIPEPDRMDHPFKATSARCINVDRTAEKRARKLAVRLSERAARKPGLLLAKPFAGRAGCRK